jgi:thiol:disulfide interchange protein
MMKNNLLSGSFLLFTRTVCLLLALSTAPRAQLTFDIIPAPSPRQDPVQVSIDRAIDSTAKMLTYTLTLEMKKHIHVYAAESLYFALEETAVEGLGDARIEFPSPERYRNVDGTIVDVYVDGQKFVISRPIVQELWSLSGYIRYQACDSILCYMPQKKLFTLSSAGEISIEGDSGRSAASLDAISQDGGRRWDNVVEGFEITGSHGGYLPPDKFHAFLNDPSGISERGVFNFHDKSMWIVILLILLGGIALNLTPCVLPVIPITVAVLGAGAQSASKLRGFVVGGIYGLAMALTYGLTGALVVVTGTTFGVINSSPLFNAFIAVIFTVLALAMFDIIHIDFTKYRSGIRHDENRRGKFITVFFMGIVTALLAGACVAPVVIAVILYSAALYTEGTVAGVLLPFLLGVGMALPWPFAGAGLSFLPKPGKWMQWVKYIFGVIILIIALYYGYTAFELFRQSPSFERSPIAESSGSPQLQWHHSLVEGLTIAESTQRPVFLDFWATWCKNCKAMEATTLRDSSVIEALKDYVLIKYQAENPDAPETKRVLDYFGAVGLPTYVILTPSEQSP